MHPERRAKNGDLKHSLACKAAFGRKDAECPRCVELMNGAPARSGWQKDYYELKNQNNFANELKSHKQNCEACKTGQVCTFGEW